MLIHSNDVQSGTNTELLYIIMLWWDKVQDLALNEPDTWGIYGFNHWKTHCVIPRSYLNKCWVFQNIVIFSWGCHTLGQRSCRMDRLCRVVWEIQSLLNWAEAEGTESWPCFQTVGAWETLTLTRVLHGAQRGHLSVCDSRRDMGNTEKCLLARHGSCVWKISSSENQLWKCFCRASVAPSPFSELQDKSHIKGHVLITLKNKHSDLEWKRNYLRGKMKYEWRYISIGGWSVSQSVKNKQSCLRGDAKCGRGCSLSTQVEEIRVLICYVVKRLLPIRGKGKIHPPAFEEKALTWL